MHTLLAVAFPPDRDNGRVDGVQDPGFLGFAGWPRSPARLEVNGGGPGLVIRTRSTVTGEVPLLHV
jgi:hypothetical protein